MWNVEFGTVPANIFCALWCLTSNFFKIWRKLRRKLLKKK
ncbi:hypothetical protein Nmel_007058 [Mimus melanotis]